MNRLTKLLVICCTVTVLSGCNRITNKAASTPEEFARSVVELLAANDSEELLAFLFPSTEEIRDFAPEVVPVARGLAGLRLRLTSRVLAFAKGAEESLQAA